MRREYTMTSPQQLYPDRQGHRSPYLSPKNNPQPSYTSFKSPSQRQEDPLEKKYPTSSKYNPIQEPPYKPTPQYHSPESSQAIEISELRLTIIQLRSSLQTSTQNMQRMQEELFLERSKNVELNQVRRRMEEELSRMEFELDRIGNYDALESREASIKLENAVRQNNRLSLQVSDLIEEIKSLKNDQRKLMSECDTLLKEKQVLMQENQSLHEKLEGLEGEIRQVKQEVARHSQESIRLHSDSAIPSRVNNLHTVRTYQASTINNSPRPQPSRHSIELEHLPEEIDYEEENEKLLKDYQRLLEENESMKQLYNNFYSAENKSNLQSPSKVNMHTFSNKAIAHQLDSSRNESPKPEENTGVMLKTMQKKQLKEEISEVREAAIGELMKVYAKSVEKANSERKNCLKMFIHQLVKNKQVYSQMAQNYLEVRMAVQEETGLKFPEKLDEVVVQSDREKMILQMYKSVKEKWKSQKEVGTSLSIFRLLTLLAKTGPISTNLSDNIKHSLLKYVYKLNNKERINTDK